MKNPKRLRITNEEKEVTATALIVLTSTFQPIVTAEILSRLPTKSIGRFASVSKSWRNLITSRSFSSTRAKNNPFSAFYAASQYFDEGRESHIVDVSETGEYVRTTLRPRVHGLSEESRMTQIIVGSCNGLLCLLQWRHDCEVITILNPLTDEGTVTTLPNHGDWIDGLHREEDITKRCYSFGYSPSTNEYKVFKGICIDRGLYIHSSYAIFTVGVNYIVALDIARESARRISIPHQRDHWSLRLLALDDRLCLCRTYMQSGNAIVWKMEGRGDDHYWSRIVVLKVGFCDDGGEIFTPVNFATKHGGILLRGDRSGHLSLYCPEQKRHTAIFRIPCETVLLFGFAPSLLSIDEIVHGKSRNMLGLGRSR